MGAVTRAVAEHGDRHAAGGAKRGAAAWGEDGGAGTHVPGGDGGDGGARVGGEALALVSHHIQKLTRAHHRFRHKISNFEKMTFEKLFGT